MTLQVSLRDGEKMIINGAVIRSIGRSSVQVENQATILRGREVMSPEEANTPARRLYFACMMAYVHTEELGTYHGQILTLLADLMDALQAPEAKATCVRFANHVGACDFYRALNECRALIAYETEALARIQSQAA